MSIDIQYPFSDKVGFVKYKYHAGDDLSVVNSARVSFNKESKLIDGQLSDDDKGLIRYLARHGHWTPFANNSITLHIKMPIFVARQWFKHQVAFNRNEVSRRYVSDAPDFFIPEAWRAKAENKKQGSDENTVITEIGAETPWVCRDPNHDHASAFDEEPQVIREFNEAVRNRKEHPTDIAKELMELCLWNYERFIQYGVCPEQARMLLPQAMYTEFWETASLAGYSRMYGLRTDPHAQKEVRQYAQSVGEIMNHLFPYSWSQLTNAPST